ncbi:MAG: PAS domain S-box protein [Smithellaceae bacterium]|nr:PAS domain S-box protein [Smithellaceae bacterium]
MDKTRIMVVEDEGVVAHDIARQLTDMGYDVVSISYAGEDAVEQAGKLHPDLVLMDIVLAGEMDGIEAADIIHSRGDIPVVFLTAYTDQKLLKRAQLVHPYGYMLKPFQRNDLKVAVEMALYISQVDRKRRKAEESLQEREEKYRTILENMQEGYFEMDLAGNYTFVNDAECRNIGYPKEELIGMNNRQYQDETTAQKMYQFFRRLYRTGEPVKALDVEIIRKNGTKGFNEVSVSLIRDSEGKPIGFWGISRDITDRKRAEAELKETLESLRKSFGTIIQVMVSAVESRDPYTSGHQIRSADLARAIATEMELPQDVIEGLRMAGSIHDIGKLSIPAEILSKPTKLTNLEFSLIKEHSRKGYEMLKDVESPWPLAEIVHQHHERMDGSGYPRNLKGEEILIEARILMVADVVEAMASHRPYRPGLGIDAALNEIEKNRGIFYDKTVADACLRLFREKGFKLEDA